MSTPLLPVHHRVLAGLLASVALLAACGTALAAEDKPGANKALRRLQQELSHAQEDKAAAETAKAELSTRLEKTEAELKKAQTAAGEAGAARKALAEERRRNEAQQAALQQDYKAKMAELVNQANERTSQADTAIAALRAKLEASETRSRELERTSQQQETRLRGELGERTEALGSCEKKNGELVALNAQLRKLYADKGFFSLLGSKEPLTGLGKVREENTLQDIEDRASDAEVKAAHP